MDDFHSVMATTFHPAEDGDLQPIRTRSQEMVDKATAWYNSTVPQGYDKKLTTATLKKLVKGTKEIDKMVKANATDKELVNKLTALHDVFHEIMEKCRKEDHH
jgi:phosphomevalonate kinase